MDLGSDKYEVIRPIASGGMAKVFLGRATGSGAFERLVAMKVMHEHLAEEDDFVAMFLDEARLAARIRHPNVVATIDVVDGAVPFLVMDLVEGPTFRTLLQEMKRQNETLPIDVALRILTDALLGLHAAHELRDADGTALNIVHRDVSPQNVLVGNDGISRLADFGVAKAEVRIASTRDGHMKGKVAHMAPEQLAGDAVDRRADIYAAGSMLWEALTGATRLSAETQPTLIFKALNPKHVRPSEKKPGLTPAFDDVCLRAMAVNRDERYATALELADALEAAAIAAGLSVATQRRVAQYVASLNLPELSSPDSSQSLSALTGKSLDEVRMTNRDTAPSVTSMDITTPSPRGARAWSFRSAIAGGAVAIAVVGVVALGLSLSDSEPSRDDRADPDGPASSGVSTTERAPDPSPDVTASPTVSSVAPEPSVTASASADVPTPKAQPRPPSRPPQVPPPPRKKRGGSKDFDPSVL